MKTTLTPQQNKMATFLRKETEGDDVEASVAPPGIQSNGQSSGAEMSDFTTGEVWPTTTNAEEDREFLHLSTAVK
ncbi:hypothetical protein RUM44_013962 [Polyplax serrata]|uniref:Uncharacterized protein n=1 Tax=Polyplax serrata TaxID=468196 RepID=A0ABR1BJ60_POLSC